MSYPRSSDLLRVLVCIDCSGIHRNLGVHISTVKSLTLDKWQPKWIYTVSKVGNKVGNRYYEFRIPDNFRRPVHSDGVGAVEHFIRAKYERKEYAPKGEPSPSELVARGVVRQVSQPVHTESILVEDELSPKSNVKVTLSVPSISAPSESLDLLGGLSPVKTSFQPVYPSASLPVNSVPYTNEAALTNPKPVPLHSMVEEKKTSLNGFGDIDAFSIFAGRK